jgi:thiamine biosynthesis lipoprotein
MDTLVTIEVPAPPADDLCREAISRAFGWFREVEQRCSRFDPDSELASLSRTTDVALPVSDLLFRAIEFALAVARESDGAFDPTVGRTLECHGFYRNFRTGDRWPALRGRRHRHHDYRHGPGGAPSRCRRRADRGAVAKGL